MSMTVFGFKLLSGASSFRMPALPGSQPFSGAS
jgi:hypothetical protein